MILNFPQVDWLTFTSWEEGVYRGWKTWQERKGGDEKAGRIRMYDGRWRGSTFVGEGVQSGSRHALVRVSGEGSHEAFGELVQFGAMKCTRIDIQVTTELPANYSARKFSDDLRAGQEGEYRRDIRMYENTDGLDTVYIGSGSSDRFARIYVKEIDGDRFLRFEVEHKSAWAEAVAKKYQTDKNSLPGILMDFIDSVGVDDTQGILQLYSGLLDAIKAGIILPSVVRDEDKTMDWIMYQVTPALVRLLADHDKGSYLAEHLLGLVEKHFKG